MQATVTTSIPSTRRRLGATLRRMYEISPLLALTGVAMVPLLLVTLVGLIVDPQVITGAPAWLKPLKFALSGFIYMGTLLYLLTFVEGRQRLISLVANVTAGGLLIEIALIVMQVVRGTTSHFNHTTPFDTAVYGVMAGFVVLVWLAGALVALLLLRQKLPDAAWAWSLRLGMLIALLGMAVAFLMTIPTAAQLTQAEAGHGLPIVGAHSVGVADGGPGLPLVGWSTVGGDLRIPHFVGLHGLQVLLLVGIVVGQTATWLDVRHRVALVITAGISYIALIALLTWQALRAQSLIHPDALTLGTFAALVIATLAVGSGIVLHGRRA